VVTKIDIAIITSFYIEFLSVIGIIAYELSIVNEFCGKNSAEIFIINSMILMMLNFFYIMDKYV